MVSAVSAMAFSPDNAQLAVGTQSGRIELWTADGERMVRPLSRHKGKVVSLAFSRDSRQLASVSADGTLIRWQGSTGKPNQTTIHPLAGREELRAAAIAIGGDWFAQSMGDRSEWPHAARLEVWSTRRRAPVRQLDPPHEILQSVAISPDGRWVAAGTERPVAYVWDLNTGHLAHELETNGDVLSLAFSPDSRLLAVGSFPPDDDGAGAIQLIDVVSGKPLWTNSDQLMLVRSLAFDDSGSSLASVSDDGSARIWETATGHEKWFTAGYTSAGQGVAFSPDGRLLATTSRGRRIRVWSTMNWAEQPAFVSPCRSTNTIKFSLGGSFLVAGDPCSTMKVWNVGTRRVQRTIEADQIWSFDISPDDRFLAWADTTIYPKAQQWIARIAELATGVPVRSLPAIPPQSQVFGFGRVKFTDEGELLTWDITTVALRNAMTGAIRWTFGFKGHTASLALLPRAQAAIGDGNEIRVHALADGGVVRSFSAPSCLAGLTASLDGRWLACSGYRITDGRRRPDDPVAIVLDAATGNIVRTFSGHTKEVDALAFSPDNQWLISGARDGSVRVWNVGDLPKSAGAK